MGTISVISRGFHGVPWDVYQRNLRSLHCDGRPHRSYFPKNERFEAEEMAEIAGEFEKDIASVFNASEQEFQERLGDKPFLVVDQTRYKQANVQERFQNTTPSTSVSR